jgi:hypothetical protein
MKDASNMPLEELLAPEVITEKMDIELAELAVSVLLCGYRCFPRATSIDLDLVAGLLGQSGSTNKARCLAQPGRRQIIS